ncbi:MAG TPA: fatty acid desaturase [Allosphingosinicella sp.]|jgi:stearoyl-CoA desaturase (delta-9 desaturase)
MEQQARSGFVRVDAPNAMLFDGISAKTQRNHFVILTAMPIPLTVAALLWVPPTASNLVVVALLWFLTSAGVACGNHRYLSHKSFVPVKRLKQFLVILGSMAGQGPPILWAAFHRRHHQCTDKAGDPHSPNLSGTGPLRRARGVVHAAFSWMRRHQYPNPMVYAPDLIRDPDIGWVNKHYYKWVVLGMVLPAAIEGAIRGTAFGALSGFVWGWGVRAFILNSVIGYINSFNHLIGTREFATRDNSRNQWWMTFPTLGESWHNNHHAFPGSAHAGLKARRLDITYGLIKAGERLGWVSDVKVPAASRVAAKRAAMSAPAAEAPITEAEA